jgi:hypothetical protein
MVLTRKAPVGERVFGGVLQERRRLREAVAQSVGDLSQLRHRARMIWLRKDRSRDRGNRLAGALRHGGQQVPHEVHPAPLPSGRSGQWRSPVSIRRVRRRCKRRTPLRPRFTRLRRNAVLKARSSDGPTSSVGDADRDHRRLGRDVPIDADLVIPGVDPHVGMFADEGTESLTVVVAVVLDTIYQLFVLRTFYPLQLLVVAVSCAVVPYALSRALVTRLARGRDIKHSAPSASRS